MSINLTKPLGRVNDIKRKLFYDPDVSLKLLDLNTLLLELFDNWFMDMEPTSSVGAGGEFFELYIADVDDNLNDQITLATRANINGEIFKVDSTNSKPKGLTKFWTLRLQKTGE